MQLFNMAGVAATAMAAGADMELACTHPRDDEPAYYPNANPQESFELWDEYINGVRGRKGRLCGMLLKLLLLIWGTAHITPP